MASIDCDGQQCLMIADYVWSGLHFWIQAIALAVLSIKATNGIVRCLPEPPWYLIENTGYVWKMAGMAGMASGNVAAASWAIKKFVGWHSPYMGLYLLGCIRFIKSMNSEPLLTNPDNPVLTWDRESSHDSCWDMWSHTFLAHALDEAALMFLFAQTTVQGPKTAKTQLSEHEINATYWQAWQTDYNAYYCQGVSCHNRKK